MKEIVLLIFILIKTCTSEDPFSLLGIPSLNPSALFSNKYDYTSNYYNKVHNQLNSFMKNNGNYGDSNLSFLQSKSQSMTNKINNISSNNENSIESITNKLTQVGFTGKDSIQSISRYLLANSNSLKNIGVVFDKTLFSGLNPDENIAYDNDQRQMQKIKSVSNLYMSGNLRNNNYEAFSIEKNNNIKISNWQVYKVIMANKSNINDHYYLSICYPIESMFPPIVLQSKEDCRDEIKEVTKELNNNFEVISQIRQLKLFKENSNDYEEIRGNNKSSDNSIINDFKQFKEFKFAENSKVDNSNNARNSNNNGNNNVNSNLLKESIRKNKENNSRIIPHNNISLTHPDMNINSANNTNNIINNNTSKTEENTIIGKADDFKQLQTSINNINNHLNQLESRIKNNETNYLNQNTQIIKMQSSLEKGFNKLDAVLEKLSIKLEK